MKNLFFVLSVFLLASCSHNAVSDSRSHIFKVKKCDVYVKASSDEAGNVILSFAKDSTNIGDEDCIRYANNGQMYFSVKGDSIIFPSELSAPISQKSTSFSFGIRPADALERMVYKESAVSIKLMKKGYTWVVEQTS